MKRLTWSIATALALAVPAIAGAANGYVTGNIHLRAGPGWDYPMISGIQAGTPILVQGCTAGWQWCDVVVYRDRGWLPGSYIQSDYQGQRAPVLTYGQRIGLPIVTFEIGNYWDSYYRGRPFYGDRGHWDRDWHGGDPGYHHGPPPVYHHPIDYPPPYHHHPIDYPPPHHHPIDYPPPYHHPQNPPPRVVPLPKPIYGPPINPPQPNHGSSVQDQPANNH